MPEDCRNLVGQLCVRAGMLMEDRSPELITSLSAEELTIVARLNTMEQAGLDLIALARAGRALVRIGWEVD
jgi:hypothetical protein